MRSLLTQQFVVLILQPLDVGLHVYAGGLQSAVQFIELGLQVFNDVLFILHQLRHLLGRDQTGGGFFELLPFPAHHRQTQGQAHCKNQNQFHHAER